MSKLQQTTKVSVPALILLLTYFSGAVQTDRWHSLFHADDYATLHSPENEKDACHNAIYHRDSKHQCHHDSHLSASAKCPLCELVYHTDHLSVSGEVPSVLSLTQSFYSQHETHEARVSSYLLPTRAPPADTIC